MRLVSYQDVQGASRSGAFIDNDERIVDFLLADESVHAKQRPEIASVLALVEGGEASLQLARELVEQAPESSIVDRSKVSLLAPIQLSLIHI